MRGIMGNPNSTPTLSDEELQHTSIREPTSGVVVRSRVSISALRIVSCGFAWRHNKEIQAGLID
jgi:hypothetical protein